MIEQSDWLAGRSDKSARSNVAKPKEKKSRFYQVHSLSSSSYHLLQPFYNLYMYLLEPLTPAQVQNTVQLYPALLAHNNSSTLPLFQKMKLPSTFFMCSKKRKPPTHRRTLFRAFYFLSFYYVFLGMAKNGNAIFVHVIYSKKPIKLFRDFSLFQFAPICPCVRTGSFNFNFSKLKSKFKFIFVILFYLSGCSTRISYLKFPLALL